MSDTFTPIQNLTDEARAKARLGSIYLDAFKSDWYKKITRPIDVDSFYDCPVGQTFNSYAAGMKLMGMDNLNERCKHGFTVNYGNESDKIKPFLDAAWEEEILKRKNKVKPITTSSSQNKVMNLFVALPLETQKNFKDKLRAQIMAAGEAIDELVCNPLVEDEDTIELKKMIGFLSNMADEVEAL